VLYPLSYEGVLANPSTPTSLWIIPVHGDGAAPHDDLGRIGAQLPLATRACIEVGQSHSLIAAIWTVASYRTASLS
jgi:hypothetical protein